MNNFKSTGAIYYSTITANTPVGGDYPYLDNLGDWSITGIHLTEENLPDIAGNGVIKWVRDDKVNILTYKSNKHKTMEQALLQDMGVGVDVKKGIYTVSKRISRQLGRPFRAYSFFQKDEVIVYVDRNLDKKKWDGAGQVSRQFMEEFVKHIPAKYKSWYERELKKTDRWEFTIGTSRGQLKGHAIIVDDLDVDFRLPADTKGELRHAGKRENEVFIGLIPFHAKKSMRLDTQSLIDLNDNSEEPFFTNEQLHQWLLDETELVIQSLYSGKMTTVYERLKIDEESTWHVPEYVQSGGNPFWFGGIVKSMLRQHTKALVKRAWESMRLPVPGGRYYVMVDVVGNKQIPRGHVELEYKTATAWVNAEDWCETLAERWGGADQDDALWCVPFSMKNGHKRILLWRSPNQLGEYAILKPSKECDEIPWVLADGRRYTYPYLNSKALPKVKEKQNVVYEESVSDDTILEAEAYNNRSVMEAVVRALKNKGVLGSYCNRLMLMQAVEGGYKTPLPAELEAIIDATVKTGANIAHVLVDNQEWAVKFATKHAIPAALAHRIQPLLPDEFVVRTTEDHWIDKLMVGVMKHIVWYDSEIERIAADTMPPIEVLSEGKKHLAKGAELKRIYGQIIQSATEPSDETFEEARKTSEKYLAQYSESERKNVLLGAIVQSYLMSENRVSDSVVWQMGGTKEDGTRESGIAQMTLEALRDIGVIGKRIETAEGAVLYYYADASELGVNGKGIRLSATWFNLGVAKGITEVIKAKQAGKLNLVPRNIQKELKKEVAVLSQKMANYPINIVAVTTEKWGAYGTNGNLIGYVNPREGIEGQQIIKFALPDRNGNMIAVIEPA